MASFTEYYFYLGNDLAIEKIAMTEENKDKLTRGGTYAGGGLIGGYLGGAIVPQLLRDPGEIRNLQDIMRDTDDIVNTKEFLKKHNLKTRVLTKDQVAVGLREHLPKILPKKWRSGLAKIVGRQAHEQMIRNGGAMMPGKGLIIPKDGSESILKHELGHMLQDQKYIEKKHPGMWNQLMGNQYNIEEDAWNRGQKAYGAKVNQKLKDGALGTYRNLRNKTRLGVGLGSALGLGAAYMINKDKDKNK